MIRKLFIIFILLISFTISANAALVDNGDGTITDPDRNLMWYDFTYFASDWSDANNWAESLYVAGFGDWRLPSALNSDGSGPCSGYNCTDSEIGHLFYIELGNVANSGGGALTSTGPFNNLTGFGYWLDEYDSNYSNYFDVNRGLQYIDLKDGSGGLAESAMAVRVVPEPISSILFITGGSLLAGCRYLKRKNKA